MAITPRTVFSEPRNLFVFSVSVLLLGVLAGLFVSADDRPVCPYAQQSTSNTTDSLDAGAEVGDEYVANSSATADAEPRSWPCDLVDPEPDWGESEWLRHLNCMEVRSEPNRAMLAEVDEAIDLLGLTHELALKKADYLEPIAPANDLIAFLESAIEEMGVMDGQLPHRLARALTWRGESGDLERVRRLQLLARSLMPASCEVLQTDIWVRYRLAEQTSRHPSPTAWQGVRSVIDTYLAQDCPERLHQGDWNVLAEMVSVGVAAEATNGHAGHSTLIRDVAESFEVRQVEQFCREAVPANTGLRSYCKKRVLDELFLSRR